MADMILKLTEHAKIKMAQLCITKEQIKLVIQRGGKFHQAGGYLASYGNIKVAYKPIAKNAYKIKTVFLD